MCKRLSFMLLDSSDSTVKNKWSCKQISRNYINRAVEHNKMEQNMKMKNDIKYENKPQ